MSTFIDHSNASANLHIKQLDGEEVVGERRAGGEGEAEVRKGRGERVEGRGR